MRKCVCAISSIEKGIDINIKSIYREDCDDKFRFQFKITNDIYYGYVYVVKGKITLTTTDSYSLDITEGQSVFVWSSSISSYCIDGVETQYYWIWFSLKGIALPLMTVCELGVTNRDIEKLNHCIKLLRKATIVDLARANIIFEKYVLQFLEILQNKQGATESHYRVTILKAADFIRENICELPSIQEIANMFGMTLKSFRKHFLRHIGVYPAKYIYSQKLSFARECLINTEQNISIISDMLGFYSPFYFSRCFKKEFDCSPSEYRKRFRS